MFEVNLGGEIRINGSYDIQRQVIGIRDEDKGSRGGLSLGLSVRMYVSCRP